MAITGVADRLPGRVKSLVYLDAFVPANGDSPIGLIQRALPPEVAARFVGAFRASALADHCGTMMPIPAEAFDVAEANREGVNRRRVPQALATLLTGAA
jgi:hypothetical protein